VLDCQRELGYSAYADYLREKGYFLLQSEKLEAERKKRDRKKRKTTEQDDEGPDELDVSYRLGKSNHTQTRMRMRRLIFTCVECF